MEDAKKAASLEDVYNGLAAEAAKSPTGEVEVSLLEKHDVTFTADFKGIAKGTKLKGISTIAKKLYVDTAKVAKQDDFTPAPKAEDDNK